MNRGIYGIVKFFTGVLIGFLGSLILINFLIVDRDKSSKALLLESKRDRSAIGSRERFSVDVNNDGKLDSVVPAGLFVQDTDLDGQQDFVSEGNPNLIYKPELLFNNQLPTANSTDYSLNPPIAQLVTTRLKSSYKRVWDTNGTYLENTWRQLVSDLDGDNRTDLVVSDYNGSTGSDVATLHVFEQSGDNRFTEVWNFSDPSNGPRVFTDMEFGDVDGDGKKELVVGKLGGSYFGGPFKLPRVYIFASNGDNAYFLKKIVEIPVGVNHEMIQLKEIALDDLNQDGKLDIVVGIGDFSGEENGSQITILTYDSATGNYDIIFSYSTVEDDMTAMAAGDSDNDGKREVVWFEGAAVRLNILEYEGGSFTFKRPVSGLSQGYGLDMQIGDLDGDRSAEILVGGRVNSDNGNIYIIKATGNDAYRLFWKSEPVSWTVLAVATGREYPPTIIGSSHRGVPGDSKSDVLILRYNESQGIFETLDHLIIDFPSPVDLRDIDIGSFDGDTRMDFIMTEFTKANTSGKYSMYEISP